MKGTWKGYSSFEWTVLAVVLLLILMLLWFSWGMALAGLLLAVAGYLYSRRQLEAERCRREETFDRMAKGITQASAFALQNLPLGMVMIDQKGRICWTNSVFRDWVTVDSDKTVRLNGLMPTLRLDKLWGKSGFFKETVQDRHYRVVYKTLEAPSLQHQELKGEELDTYMIFYFEDITDVERERLAALDRVPAYGFIVMDNIEDLSNGLSDVEYTDLWAEINRLIVAEFNKYDGFIKTHADNTYLFALNRGSLEKMMEAKFPLLDAVHNLATSRRIPPTISMGIALTDDTTKVQAEKAKAALEIALGRGGDQVCLYHGDEVKFFGGKTQGIEKNTRVRARVISQALREIILDSDNVVVMGHEREDYDSIGSAVGVAAMAKALGKDVHVAVSGQITAVKKLAELFQEDTQFKDLLVSPEVAAQLVKENTVVIVTDVHRPDMVAAPEALQKSEKRVLIDHHRRSSDFIDKLLLTYLEPASSSTSELVAELIQYLGTVQLRPVEASALYAGIVVDTKNFVVQTGARTFEAASFLRRSGADLSLVRHLFMKTFDMMQLRATMISSAERIDNMAFTQTPADVKNASVAAAQTSDVLISIEDIEASFVFYELSDGAIGISARSQGNMNVQLVMEAVGGGGHRTVAGGRLQGVTMEEARAQVTAVARKAMADLKEEQKKEDHKE